MIRFTARYPARWRRHRDPRPAGVAEVLIDGERWERPAADETLVVQVAPGAHRIEIRKDVYRSYTTQVDVGAGQTAPLTSACRRSEKSHDELVTRTETADAAVGGIF